MDNFFTCCFSLLVFFLMPIFQLIQGAIIVVPITLMSLIGSLVTTIIWFIPDVGFTFWTIWRTKRWGINVKILVTLIMPVAMVVWPLLVIVCALIAGFFYGLFGPMAHGFFGCWADELWYLYCGGKMPVVFRTTWHCVVDFWHVNKNYKAMLYDFRTTANADGSVFEISLYKIPIGFFLAILLGTVDTIAFVLMGVLLYIPFVYRALVEFNRFVCGCNSKKSVDDCCCQMMCCCICFIPIIVIDIIIIILIPVLLVIAPFYAFWASINASLYACNTNKFSWAFAYNHEFVSSSWYDSLTFIFGGNYNYDTPHMKGRFLEQQSAPLQQVHVEVPSYQNAAVVEEQKRISIITIWDSFFEMCTIYTREAVRENLVTQDDIECCEPYLYTGLPSFIVLRLVKRSIDSNTVGFQMADGTVVTDLNRPVGLIADSVWPKLLALRKELEELFTNNNNNCVIDDNEYTYMEKFIITLNTKPINTDSLDKDRIVQINRVASKFQDLGIMISRLPQVPRRFGEAMNEAILIKN